MKKILLLEDNDDDAFLTERALIKAGVTCEIQRYKDGQSVVDYLGGLSKEDYASDISFPYLLLLDLKTPKKTGLEVLQWIREEPFLSFMVVLALTSSSERKDVKRACELHVNAYLVKPASLTNMTELAICIKKIWLDSSNYLHLTSAASLVIPSQTAPRTL